MKVDLYSAAEGQDPQQREESLLAKLPEFVAHAKQHSPMYAKLYADADPREVNTREMLAHLPAVNKSELIGAQEDMPPFAGIDCFASQDPARVYMSPGPIAECDFADEDYWKTAAAFYAAGLRRGMTLHNSFSYHFTPAGQMCESGALALGARVFPAGAGNSEQQARAMARFKCECYSGTPDFLRVILEQAESVGDDVSALKFASVSGGYLSPELREFYSARGVSATQWYGTADIGVVAFESTIGEPLIVSENLLVEIADPETRRPCAPGEKGEVLITNFNYGYPLIRFALGDLSSQVAGVSECGRTNMRLAGWLGRCDASVKVRGMFIHPAQVERVVKRVAGLEAAQLVVESADGRDEMMLHCQIGSGVAKESLQEVVASVLREETKLRGGVAFVSEISGGLIQDKREQGK